MSNLNLYNTTSGQWEEIKVDTKLNVLKNTVTLSAAVNWIFIGISNYNPASDTLYVVKDGNVLAEGIDYTFNTGNLNIYSKDGSNWPQNSTFTFSVWKNVNTTLPSADGSLLQDGSVTDTKLAMPITPSLTDSSGTVYNTLKDRLLAIDSKISKINEQVPFVFVTDYISNVINLGTSTEDWTNAIQNALNASPTYKQVILPMQTCRITKTLSVPCGTSLVGFGNSSIIQADFGYWQSTDYRAIRLITKEGVDLGGKDFNTYFENFTITGLNNTSIQSIGLDISSDSITNWATSVNYSLIFSNIRNIYINKFDTALNIKECWASNFYGISITDCRIGVNLVGKSVNLTFDKFQMTNFGTNYTSNKGKTYGIYVDKKTYSDGDGRPEGLIFTNSVVFGANTNLNVQSALFARFENILLDAASEDCVIINIPDNISIKGCYISVLNDNFAGIRFTGNGDTVINITDNYFVGSSTSTGIQTAIYCDQINHRYGINVQDNLIVYFSMGIFFNYVNKSNIINNHGVNNRGTLIYLQSDCADTKVDGNTTNDSYPVLQLHPTSSPQVKIGDNTSATTRTSYQGFATIKAGTTIASAGNGFYKQELYYRAITLIQPTGNLGNVWVAPESFWGDATIYCSNAPSSDTKVYYKTIAVPYSALN